MFKNYGLNYSWYAIFVGKSLNLITNQEIIDYAKEFLFEHPDNRNKYIWELAFEPVYNADYLLDHIYTSLNIEENSHEWNNEWTKWRYCILKYSINTIKDPEQLIYTVETVYAQFGYPKDMEGFIYYMPNTDTERDPKQYSPEENYQYLKDKLIKFLENEQLKIGKNVHSK